MYSVYFYYCSRFGGCWKLGIVKRQTYFTLLVLFLCTASDNTTITITADSQHSTVLELILGKHPIFQCLLYICDHDLLMLMFPGIIFKDCYVLAMRHCCVTSSTISLYHQGSEFTSCLV